MYYSHLIIVAMVDPFSIIAIVDLCFKYGRELIQICSTFAHAESELTERLLRVKNYWIRAEVQLKLVRSIAHTLDKEHEKIQHETLELLASKLKIAVARIESVAKGNRVQRWKYVLLQQNIDKTIQDLELWQQLFDPSWYLIMKAATPQIDAELKTYKRAVAADTQASVSSAQSLRFALNPALANKIPIFLPEDGLGSLQFHDIPLCAARMALRGDPTKSLILERCEPSPGVDVRQLEKDVRDLARKLAHCDPLEFGLLNCKGVIKHYEQNPNHAELDAFTIIFRVPQGFSQPRSLRSCLQDMKGTDSLSDRFRLANELARSVSYVHTFGFVHKNIRPETILLLKSEESAIGSVFLIGFDSFRMAEGKTLRKGHSAWERCLYQHTSRMGLTPTEDYIMQHDIYSLGVCLLELGLWESFVLYDDQKSGLPTGDRATNATRSLSLGVDLPPLSFQDRLLSLARGELRSRMGTRYSEIVITCLTCLDPGNTDFGDESEFLDEDGIQVGVRYIEKVTMRLGSICV